MVVKVRNTQMETIGSMLFFSLSSLASAATTASASSIASASEYIAWIINVSRVHSDDYGKKQHLIEEETTRTDLENQDTSHMERGMPCSLVERRAPFEGGEVLFVCAECDTRIESGLNIYFMSDRCFCSVLCRINHNCT